MHRRIFVYFSLYRNLMFIVSLTCQHVKSSFFCSPVFLFCLPLLHSLLFNTCLIRLKVEETMLLDKCLKGFWKKNHEPHRFNFPNHLQSCAYTPLALFPVKNVCMLKIQNAPCSHHRLYDLRKREKKNGLHKKRHV